MKGDNVIVIGEASGSSSSKRHKINKGREIDRISNLPDSVLAHILSFLPTQDAVKTILLRRFGFLWTSSDTLHFDACSFHDCEAEYYDDGDEGDSPRSDDSFINFIRHVLTLHERNPIHRFHLKLEFLMYHSVDEDSLEDPTSQKLCKREMRLANEINTWIRFAIRRGVEVLDLDFFACGDDFDEDQLYRIPDFVFKCDSIRELKLFFCKVEPQGQILMRSLRTLFLQRVVLNRNIIDEIVSGLPLLESLSLIECYNLCKLNFVSPNLKYLKVVISRFELFRLEISGPNITSLDISGSVGLADLKSFCSLKDASIGFECHYRWSTDDDHEARKVLENLSHAMVLTIYEESILLWTVWELKMISFPPMHQRHLILNTELTMEHLPGIATLLRSSPCLEMLDIHITEACDSYDCFYERELCGENYWSEHEESFQGITNSLQTVRIYGLVGESCVLQLVQFLLKNLMGLEKMVITFESSEDLNQESYITSDEAQELSQKLLSFPKASASAVILFPEM